MSLATLLNIPGRTVSLSEWAFSNMDQHRNISSMVFSQQGVLLQVYPLDPIPVSNFSGWLQLHQQAHNDGASVLGIENYDLSALDINDMDQVQAWIRLHFDWHQQAAQKIGLN